jgi:hypothetical protein
LPYIPPADMADMAITPPYPPGVRMGKWRIDHPMTNLADMANKERST